jgi:hypothetical protein
MQHDVNREGKRRGRPPNLICGKTLADLGITRQQAQRFRRLAEIPKDVFEMLLAEMRERGRPCGSGTLIKEWDMMNQRHHAPRLPASLERMAALLRRHGYTVFSPR